MSGLLLLGAIVLAVDVAHDLVKLTRRRRAERWFPRRGRT